MFDVGFMEMALIGVVALVVVGPERLPGLARTVGHWMGTARRFVSSVQSDINVEVSKVDQLKRLLEEQANIQSVHEIIEDTPVAKDARKPVPRAPVSRQRLSEEVAAQAADNLPPMQSPEQQTEQVAAYELRAISAGVDHVVTKNAVTDPAAAEKTATSATEKSDNTTNNKAANVDVTQKHD
jgi:sec-independent protein translocase protein TatB